MAQVISDKWAEVDSLSSWKDHIMFVYLIEKIMLSLIVGERTHCSFLYSWLRLVSSFLHLIKLVVFIADLLPSQEMIV